MSLSVRPIPRPGDGYAPLPHHHWLSVVRGCPPSIRPFPLLLPILGTVCLNMSRPHPLCLFSEDGWRLSSLGVPFLELVTATLVVIAQWLYSFLALKSFFLLTYRRMLLQPSADVFLAWTWLPRGGGSTHLIIFECWSFTHTITITTRRSCTGQAQCEVSAYAPSCRCCVATCLKEQTRRSENCRYLR